MHKGQLRLPGEYEPQLATILLVPYRKDIWRANCKPITDMIVRLANTIARFQPVFLGVNEPEAEIKNYRLEQNVRPVSLKYNDAWARDSISSVLLGETKLIAGFQFNAYGDGLYEPWDDDNTLSEQVSQLLGYGLEKNFLVLEGGNIMPDGNGTVFAVQDCIVNANRNPGMSVEKVEELLKKVTRCSRVVWLEHGLEYDETGGHIDNVMAFADSKTIILSWTDDKTNPHYERTHEIYDRLVNATDIDGNPYKIIKLPVPPPSVRTEKECEGLVEKSGSYARRAGDMVLDTYVNFVPVNNAVIVPQFNTELDKVAVDVLKSAFPNREIVPFFSREASLGGGGLHCLTKHIN